jgi:hypothetical protein
MSMLKITGISSSNPLYDVSELFIIFAKIL